MHCWICILVNVRIIVHNTLCCCYKYRVLSNLILFTLISSAIVGDLVIIYFIFIYIQLRLNVDHFKIRRNLIKIGI